MSHVNNCSTQFGQVFWCCCQIEHSSHCTHSFARLHLCSKSSAPPGLVLEVAEVLAVPALFSLPDGSTTSLADLLRPRPDRERGGTGRWEAGATLGLLGD